jgi:hypothetical protein
MLMCWHETRLLRNISEGQKVESLGFEPSVYEFAIDDSPSLEIAHSVGTVWFVMLGQRAFR